MSISKNSIPITSMAQWELAGGPKKQSQWADDRSAKETARAWLENIDHLPLEVTAVLESRIAFGSVLSWTGEPEVQLRFDAFRGEPRNSDLLVVALDHHGPYLIAVEAKADETFGGTVAETLVACTERYLETDRSNGVARVLQLGQAIFGCRREAEPDIGILRYQLLTAVAGALCEADRRGFRRAVMMIHEFVTDRTTDELHDRNAVDLD